MFKNLKFFTSRQHRQENRHLLPVQTDIHAHLVPGIDDGARDVQQAADLAQGIEELGIRKMILTPHVTDEVYPNSPSSIDTPLADLRAELAARGSELKLIASAEYRIDELLYSQLKEGMVRPMPGNYLLIECGWIAEPMRLDTFVRELIDRYGYKPVLAHPERYPYYISKPSNYQRLRRLGLLFQVNLLSLAGLYGKHIKALAKELIEKNMVEFIGSDMHHQRHLDTIRKYLGSGDFSFLQRHSDRLLNDTLSPLI